MRLCFLLEGRRTEPKLYRRWLSFAFPDLSEVIDPVKLQGDGYWLVTGGGQPGIFDRIPEVTADLDDWNAEITGFFLCLDSEDEPFVDVQKRAVELLQLHARPGFHPIAVVQHCCIETWLLADRELYRQAARDPELAAFRSFYDASRQDPEEMPCASGFETRAQFHTRYLKAAARDINKSYSKTKPGKFFSEESHFRRLIERRFESGHIPSFGTLTDSWQAMGGHI